jgi:hypothetical protein
LQKYVDAIDQECGKYNMPFTDASVYDTDGYYVRTFCGVCY